MAEGKLGLHERAGPAVARLEPRQVRGDSKREGREGARHEVRCRRARRLTSTRSQEWMVVMVDGEQPVGGSGMGWEEG